MVNLHIVRHGETVWHAENRYAGHSDVPLTPLGLQQGENLVPWATTASLNAVASSDLSRARLTAEPIARALGLHLVVDPGLRELNFGEGEGMTSQEMFEKFPEERRNFETTPATAPLPGAESGLTAVERALPAIYRVISQPGVSNALFVIHSTLGRLLLCEFLGIELNRYRTLFPSLVNGAVTTVRFSRTDSPDSLRGSGAFIALNAPTH